MVEHTKHDFTQLCDALGEDLDAPICRELADHVEECPECRIILDTVKQVVYLYREVVSEENVPEDVNRRLFKILNLPRNRNS